MIMVPMHTDMLLTSNPLESTVDGSIRPQTISKPSNKYTVNNMFKRQHLQIQQVSNWSSHPSPKFWNPSIVFIYIMFLSQWCILIWMDFRANLLELWPVLVTKLTLAGNQKNINELGTCDPYILRTHHVFLENKWPYDYDPTWKESVATRNWFL